MAGRLSKASLLKWRQARGGSSPSVTRCGKATFRWGERTYVMGIVNVSPDSFSGDGLNSVDAAVAQAQRFATEGVDILDVGGESTRPDSSPTSVPLSVDTYKLDVAHRALDAGAEMINDIWGLNKEPRLAELAAERAVPIILMSNQRDKPQRNIVPAVIEDLKRSIDLALDSGVPWENIIVDPGIGFGKTLEQNLELVRRLDELKVLGRPILLGTSRKSMIGLVLDLPPEQRLEGTAASTAIGIARGADIIRVHDVKEMIRICRMSDAIIRSKRS
jgi:dihydropteroate synthase